jgi:hypothetical protein
MDGSGLSLILIPIVMSISLGAWLLLVYYADAHRPGWQQDLMPPPGDRSSAAGTPAPHGSPSQV